MNPFNRLASAIGLSLTTIAMIISATASDSLTEEIRISNKTVIHKNFQEIPSTQTLSHEIIDDLVKGNPQKLIEIFNKEKIYEDEVLLITATQQTAGIGHNGRSWQSPPGNIYATFTFPWPEDLQRLLFFVPQVSNLAVCKTVQSFGFDPKFKWINDMLLDNKKSAGVLCQNKGFTPFYKRNDEPSDVRHSSLIVGIGLNVNMDQNLANERFEATSDLMKVPFTSMKIVSGNTFDIEEILMVLTRNLIENYQTLLSEGNFARDFLPSISSMLAYVGQEVQYSEENRDPYRVRFLGIQNDGQIILNDGEKDLTKFTGRIRPFNYEEHK